MSCASRAKSAPALAEIEQDVRGVDLLGHAVLVAADGVELTGARFELRLARIELPARGLLDLRDVQGGVGPVDLQRAAALHVGILVQVARARLHGERLAHEHAHQEVGHALPVRLRSRRV
jgi:hypothetical protein